MSHYRGDIALLNYLLQDLRALMRRHRKGEIEITPHQVFSWDVHGLQRHTVHIEATKYWDYDTNDGWHAIRHLPEVASERLAGDDEVIEAAAAAEALKVEQV